METNDLLAELVGQDVVIDLASPYVCLGRLWKYDEKFLIVRNADFHDLRDTETSRENYIADSVVSGIKRNRKRVWVVRNEVVAIAAFQDVVDE